MTTGWKLALGALLLVGGLFAFNRWIQGERGDARDAGVKSGQAEIQGKWDKDVIERDRKQAEAVNEARREERRMAATAAQGERDAREKAESQARSDRAAAAAAAAAERGLSGDIAALDDGARALGIPGVAACPAEFVRQRDAAVRARGLLGACATEYRELAAAVDDTWRAITLRLDTAMSWIASVQPTSTGARHGPQD
jgi:hypothetical protein